MMKKIFAIFLFVLTLSKLFAAESQGAKKLTLGFMPYVESSNLIKAYTPLAEYLGKKLNMKVEIVIAKDYKSHLEATGKDKLDISFLGGSPYVVITEKYGPKPLLVRYEFDGKPTFRAVVFGAKNSGVKNLQELEGKSIVFGNPNSTLSTQVPAWMFLSAGVKLDKNNTKFVANHENVIFGVLSGDYSAGCVSEEIYRQNIKKGIQAIAFSPELSTHLFVTRANMDKELVEKIKSAFLELKEKNVLGSISKNLSGFVPVKDEDYDLHRRILEDAIPLVEKLHGDK